MLVLSYVAVSIETIVDRLAPFPLPVLTIDFFFQDINFTTVFELGSELGVKKINKNVKPSKLLQIAQEVASSTQVTRVIRVTRHVVDIPRP